MRIRGERKKKNIIQLQFSSDQKMIEEMSIFKGNEFRHAILLQRNDVKIFSRSKMAFSAALWLNKCITVNQCKSSVPLSSLQSEFDLGSTANSKSAWRQRDCNIEKTRPYTRLLLSRAVGQGQ